MNVQAIKLSLIEWLLRLQDERTIKELISLREKRTAKKSETAPAKKALSRLKGKVSKMSGDEIDKRLKSIRSEWQRDI
jgi:hypothetical protein